MLKIIFFKLQFSNNFQISNSQIILTFQIPFFLRIFLDPKNLIFNKIYCHFLFGKYF